MKLQENSMERVSRIDQQTFCSEDSKICPRKWPWLSVLFEKIANCFWEIIPDPANICLFKVIIETLEKVVKYVQS